MPRFSDLPSGLRFSLPCGCVGVTGDKPPDAIGQLAVPAEPAGACFHHQGQGSVTVTADTDVVVLGRVAAEEAGG
jgi:hypothetical protein